MTSGLRLGDISELVLLGAHCDDLAIGAGATLLQTCARRPDLRVTALVLTGGGTAREAEERAALAEFCPGASLDVTVLDLPDGRAPAHWDTVKQALQDLAGRCRPDLVLAPCRHDAHQDHRLLAELAPTAFRGRFVLGYEILKWESDLAQPSVFVPVDESTARRKAQLLVEHYASQRDRSWFDCEAFLGLARVRGVQCGARYAEAFHAEKMVLSTR